MNEHLAECLTPLCLSIALARRDHLPNHDLKSGTWSLKKPLSSLHEFDAHRPLDECVDRGHNPEVVIGPEGTPPSF